MKKSVIAIIVAVAIIVVTVLFVSIQKEKYHKSDVIKIGAILPLSGDVAVYGKNTKKGIDLAASEINSAGGINGRKIQIIYEDSKADPKTGVTAMHKLVQTDNVQAVIDDSVSSVTLAIVPIGEKHKVVILSTGATNPQLSGVSPYFFRIWNSDSLEGQLSARYTFDDLKLSVGAIIYVNNDYGNGLCKVFDAEFRRIGGSISNKESFEQGTSDFKTQLTKIKSSNNCKFLYVVGYSKENAAIIKQVREIGLNVQIIGTVTTEDRLIIEIAGKAAEKVVYPYPQESDANNPVVSSFRRKYNTFYNENIGITSDVGYDAVYLIVRAISLSNDSTTGEDIKDGLRKIKNYNRVSGPIEFDENGDVHKPMVFKTIENDAFRYL